MSYYFTIIGTLDNPIFTHEFGTSKAGGDGQSRFPTSARAMNQFILHASLDIAEELLWAAPGTIISGASGAAGGVISAGVMSPSGGVSGVTGVSSTAPGCCMYLRCIDKFFSSYVSCFVTGSNAKFLLLHQPTVPSSSSAGGSVAASHGGVSRNSVLISGAVGGGSSSGSTGHIIGLNPTSPQTEEAIRSFFLDVYELWCKTVMNPFYETNMEIRSPVFRQKVAAAAKKYL